MFRKIVLFLLLAAPFHSGFTQEFGGFKPSKKWRQLENSNYRIIYSKENESSARKTAAVIDQMNGLDLNIGLKRRKIDIILQNSTTQANGYVGLAPFISEFFLTPFPSSFAIGSLPWPYTLGVHEYQHVLQYANSYYGVSKIGYFIGGEATWGALQFFSIPNWFFEGDAVRAETEYTQQGRGRIPTFFNGYRAFVQENEMPSYAKVRNGSFKDFVPSHYPLGYLMIRYGREKYGKQFWPTVLKEAAAYKGVFYPFSRALRRNSGKYSTQFYNSMMEDLSIQLKKPLRSFGRKLFFVPNDRVINHAFPQFDTDSSLYFIQSSYDKIARIVRLKDNELETCTYLGIRSENYFDVQDGKLAFTQTYFDKRWGWIDYQDVVIYDTETKEQQRLTKKGKYFHPSFSLDGKKIAVLKAQPNHQFFLCILDATTGEEIQVVKNPENFYFTYPTWSNEHTLVAATRDSIGQMFLATVDLNTESIQESERSFHIIGRPHPKEGKIYYAASYSGIDNLYVYDNGSISQLTKEGLGRYSPVLNPAGDSIYFTEFSLNGQHLKAASIHESEIEIAPLKALPFYNREFMKGAPFLSTSSSNDTLSSKPYSKFGKLINLHSWNLRLDDPEFGIELSSDNVLNTLDLTAAYLYNSNENASGYELSADYGQYFLHLNTSARQSYRSIPRVGTSALQIDDFESSVGLSLPLNYSSNLFSRGLRVSAAYDYIRANFADEAFQDQKVHASNAQLVYRQQLLKATKNIFTHFGIYSRTRSRVATNIHSYQLLLQNSLAFKGLFQNHNLVFDLDAQFESGLNNYSFSNSFVYARGFESFRFPTIYKASANYHFPISYPDQGGLGIAYLKRVRGNLFFDYSYTGDVTGEFNSVGAEVIFDVSWFNAFSAPIGIRYSHVLTQQQFSITGNAGFLEAFFPINRF